MLGKATQLPCHGDGRTLECLWRTLPPLKRSPLQSASPGLRDDVTMGSQQSGAAGRDRLERRIQERGSAVAGRKLKDLLDPQLTAESAASR